MLPLIGSMLGGQGSSLSSSPSSSATSKSGDITSTSSFTSGDFYTGGSSKDTGINNIVWIAAGIVVLAFLFLRKK